MNLKNLFLFLGMYASEPYLYAMMPCAVTAASIRAEPSIREVSSFKEMVEGPNGFVRYAGLEFEIVASSLKRNSDEVYDAKSLHIAAGARRLKIALILCEDLKNPEKIRNLTPEQIALLPFPSIARRGLGAFHVCETGTLHQFKEQGFFYEQLPTFVMMLQPGTSKAIKAWNKYLNQLRPSVSWGRKLLNCINRLSQLRSPASRRAFTRMN